MSDHRRESVRNQMNIKEFPFKSLKKVKLKSHSIYMHINTEILNMSFNPISRIFTRSNLYASGYMQLDFCYISIYKFRKARN